MEWLSAIIGILAVLAICVVLILKGQVAKALEIVLALVVSAEVQYGGKTGEIKRASVIKAIYDMFPGWVQVLIPKSWVDNVVEAGVDKMKELANDNKYVAELIGQIPVIDTTGGEQRGE